MIYYDDKLTHGNQDYEKFLVENCNRSLRMRHRPLLEAFEKYGQLSAQRRKNIAHWLASPDYDFEYFMHVCYQCKLVQRMSDMIKDGLCPQVIFRDKCRPLVRPLGEEDVNRIMNYQDKLPVEVLQNIQISELSEEEVLEVASRFPGMDSAPDNELRELLFLAKFGLAPTNAGEPTQTLMELPELREFIADNFIESLRRNHKPFRDALTSEPEVRSKDQAAIVNRIWTGSDKVDSETDFPRLMHRVLHCGPPIVSVSRISGIIFSDKITPGFTLNDIKAGVERRKGMVKKQNPIIEAIDKTIDELSKVKDLVSNTKKEPLTINVSSSSNSVTK
jgi:hypothetical protein